MSGRGVAPDLGGDVVIADGEYCTRCRLADASECMSTTPCSRRYIARRLNGTPSAAIDNVYYDPPREAKRYGQDTETNRISEASTAGPCPVRS